MFLRDTPYFGEPEGPQQLPTTQLSNQINQSSKQLHVSGAKHAKMCSRTSRSDLIWLITSDWWRKWCKFINQSRSVVKLESNYFSTLN